MNMIQKPNIKSCQELSSEEIKEDYLNRMKIILNFLKVKKNKTYLLNIIIYKYLLKEYFLSLLAETKKIVHFQMTNNLV